MSFDQLRQQIDENDKQIIALLAHRQELAAEVAHLKKISGKKIFDPKREKEVLDQAQKNAQKKGVDPKLVRKIFTELMKASREQQKKAFSIIDKIAPKNLRFQKKKLKIIHHGGFEIFRSIYHKFDDVFFLESLGEDPHFARYSFIGFAPRTKIVAKGSDLTVGGKHFPTNNPYFTLEKFLPRIENNLGFCGGLVGYLTYEATKYFEDALDFPSHPDFPDFEFGLFLDGLVFNKITGETEYFWYDQDRSELITKILQEKILSLGKFSARFTGCNISQAEFEKKVKSAREEIIAGNIFQVQIGRKYNFELQGDYLKFYEVLRKVNPSPQMFYLKFGERELIGSSPELIVRVENGIVENFPLAGTRKRGATPKEDQQIAKGLLANEKERAEHMMLVDLGRNDVGRVCQFGSVQPRKLMEIKRFPYVQHIGSEIIGKLRPEMTAFNALATNTPVGTVSGAPKIEAMKIIQRLENSPRGPYAGAMGYFSLNGNCNFAAGLRSLFTYKGKAYVQASAGIVDDSVPEHEFKEVEKKASGVIKALEEATAS